VLARRWGVVVGVRRTRGLVPAASVLLGARGGPS